MDIWKRIPRRNFLKHAAAAGCLSGRLAAASGRIAIITGAPNGITTSEPVRWAAGELRRSVEEKGDSCGIGSSPGEAGDFQAAVIVSVTTELEGTTAVVRSRVVVPRHQGGWVNAILLAERLDGAWNAGARTVPRGHRRLRRQRPTLVRTRNASPPRDEP
jgi:hypothetical protein